MEKNNVMPTEILSPKIDEEITEKVKEKFQEEKQVIVHCYLKADIYSQIRIWQTTYLCDNQSSHKSTLLHAFNITMYPVWMNIPVGTTVEFTLVFSGLPSTCLSFDLWENCNPQKGGFYCSNIPRTKSDVYTIWI